MTTKILVVDDDAQLVRILQARFSQEGWLVLTARDGLGALRVAYDSHPDLVLLDIGLPGIDGTEVCSRLQEMSNVPVVLLSAHSTTQDIVNGLSIGADDYITKPFDMAELVARIHTCLRRKNKPNSADKETVLVNGDLTVDLVRHKATRCGKPIDLSPTEFRLLSLLTRHAGEVVPHSRLLSEVWGPEYSGQIDYLHIYIRFLRNKLETDPAHPQMIKTERGVGYYMDS